MPDKKDGQSGVPIRETKRRELSEKSTRDSKSEEDRGGKKIKIENVRKKKK
jgi:hypothetical protein